MKIRDDRRKGPSAEDRVQRWIRPEIRGLSAYHVPPATGFVKLDAMENPYSWPEPVVDEWLSVLREVSLNRYPDPSPQRLMGRLREFFGVPAELSVLLGNGSDELIQMMALAVAAPGRKAVAADPSFSMYRMISTFAGLEFVGVAQIAICDDARGAPMLTEEGRHPRMIVGPGRAKLDFCALRND